jgi:drug/metabolite transporter (DMT)-like permease
MMTKLMLWILLILFPVGVGGGQILLKMAAQRLQSGLHPALLLDPMLIGAVALYGTLGLVWLYILKEIPLNTAYPFVALSFAVTPLLGWFILNDRPNGYYFLGIALICVGVAITQRAIHGS